MWVSGGWLKIHVGATLPVRGDMFSELSSLGSGSALLLDLHVLADIRRRKRAYIFRSLYYRMG